MRQRVILAVLLLLGVSPGGVRDGDAFGTGRELVVACREGGDLDQQMLMLRCASYIRGLVDGYVLSTTFMDERRRPICLPSRGIETGTTIDLILNWLRRHPQDQDETARSAIFQAIATAFPCKPGIKKK